MRSHLAAAFALGALCASAGAGHAAPLADGTYRCTLWLGYLSHFGDIEIEGNTYRGPAYDGNFEGDYEYQRTDAGTIDWGGPLGGLSSDGNKVVSSVVTDAGGGKEGFDIMIQSDRGTFQTVSCAP